MYVVASNLSMNNCVFKRNTAQRGGGGVGIMFSRQTNTRIISSSNFYGNTAQTGGALSTTTRTNSTNNKHTVLISMTSFHNNTATYGGATYFNREKGAAELPHIINHCSFLNNCAKVLGQTVYNNQVLEIYNVSVQAVETKTVYHIYSETKKINIQKLITHSLTDSCSFR